MGLLSTVSKWMAVHAFHLRSQPQYLGHQALFILTTKDFFSVAWLILRKTQKTRARNRNCSNSQSISPPDPWRGSLREVHWGSSKNRCGMTATDPCSKAFTYAILDTSQPGLRKKHRRTFTKFISLLPFRLGRYGTLPGKLRGKWPRLCAPILPCFGHRGVAPDRGVVLCTTQHTRCSSHKHRLLTLSTQGWYIRKSQIPPLHRTTCSLKKYSMVVINCKNKLIQIMKK